MTDTISLNGDSRSQKFHEGWAHHQPSNGKAWRRLWLLLKGNMIFVFTSDKPTDKNLIGTLTLGADTELRNGHSESKRKGFKIIVTTTSPNGQRKVNKFKFDKENDRDIWKSFIVGISVGIVPSDVHLLPGQLKDVHVAIDEVRNKPPPLPNGRFNSQVTHTIPRPQVDRPIDKSITEPSFDTDGNWSTLGQNGFANGSLRSSNSDGSSDSGTMIGHIPTKTSRSASTPEVRNVNSLFEMKNRRNRASVDNGRNGWEEPSESNISGDSGISRMSLNEIHLFYLEPERNRDIPTWFFENCSREDSEEILTVGRRFGNVLMRPSSTFNSSGKYVLSMRREVSGGTNLNHYEIIKAGDGYKINVDNKHGAMRCLSEVVDFFVSTAGPGTQPMRTNILQKIYKSGGSSVGGSSASSLSRDDDGQSSVFEAPVSPVSPASWSSSPGGGRSIPDWPGASSTNTRNGKLKVDGNVSLGIMEVVHEMNDGLCATKPAETGRGMAPWEPEEYVNTSTMRPDGFGKHSYDDNWSMIEKQFSQSSSLEGEEYENSPQIGGGNGDSTLTRTVPAKYPPLQTLQRQAGHADFHRDIERLSLGPNMPPPPPPPPGMGPPPPPPQTNGGFPPPPPPGPAFSTLQHNTGSSGHSFNTMQPNTGVGFGAPSRAPSGFNTTPHPPNPPNTRFGGGVSFEDELNKKLRNRKEEIYASATILKSNYQ